MELGSRLGGHEEAAAGGVGRQPTVIWVSGFSASGKTSVGRRLDVLLREQGMRSIFLDGDELRSIFGDRWGYSREERIELARVYFRLCSHLSSQGQTVIIAAVAMYDEVRDWVRENVPGAVQVHLDVPEEERRRRDSQTKQVYDKIGPQSQMYDPPRSPDLVIPNHGDMTSDRSADAILEHIQSVRFFYEADHGRSEHWDEFYSKAAAAPDEPSSFALAYANRVPEGGRVLEVGCGNGRDAAYLASTGGHRVLGVDLSEAAIESCRSRLETDSLTFQAGTITDLPGETEPFDVIYSRFCLHAMTVPEEDEFVAQAALRLKSGGELLIEARSIEDPLAREGEVISKTERIHGHYRRFIVLEELTAKLEAAGFSLLEAVEVAGVARHGDDDPVVVRVVARL